MVDDPAQARLLSDPNALRFFEPFLARERSASAAAGEIGARLDTLLYRVRRFLDAGLLRVVREVPRAGRPVRIYRSSADAYFVPLGVTPYADLAERIREESAPFLRDSYELLARLLVRHGAEGRRLFRAPDGEVWQDASDAPARHFLLDDPHRPAAEWTSSRVRLREEDARELLGEMRSLWTRMHERQAPGGEGRSYRVMIMLLPEEPD